MDWALAIERNRQALLQMLAALFDMVGLVPGGSIARLPRCVRRAVLLVLRPAESAVRRLVIVGARALAVPIAVPRSDPALAIPSGSGVRVPAFRLLDARKRFWCAASRRCAVEPRFTVLGYDDYPVRSEPLLASPEDEIDPTRLCGRLLALKGALDDLPRQARRMVRMLARRALAPPGPGRAPPLRPGWPPGHRTRQVHPVDEILCECDRLARRALEPPDRS